MISTNWKVAIEDCMLYRTCSNAMKTLMVLKTQWNTNYIAKKYPSSLIRQTVLIVWLKKGDTDRDSVRARIIVHNESVRPLMPCAPPKRLMNLPKFILDKIKTYRKNNVSTSNQRIADDLKGKYTVRQIIRYKNFDSN